MKIVLEQRDDRQVMLVSFEMGGLPENPKSISHLPGVITDMLNCRYEVASEHIDQVLLHQGWSRNEARVDAMNAN